MKCPYCEAVDGLMAIHRHLVDAHLDLIKTEHDEEAGRMAFVVSCPFCEFEAHRPVNPRGRNPRFLNEFKAEIALVAFDQLIYHLLEEHPQEVGVDPALLRPDDPEK